LLSYNRSINGLLRLKLPSSIAHYPSLIKWGGDKTGVSSKVGEKEQCVAVRATTDWVKYRILSKRYVSMAVFSKGYPLVVCQGCLEGGLKRG
jgi:hypothetical protein